MICDRIKFALIFLSHLLKTIIKPIGYWNVGEPRIGALKVNTLSWDTCAIPLAQVLHQVCLDAICKELVNLAMFVETFQILWILRQNFAVKRDFWRYSCGYYDILAFRVWIWCQSLVSIYFDSLFAWINDHMEADSVTLCKDLWCIENSNIVNLWADPICLFGKVIWIMQLLAQELVPFIIWLEKWAALRWIDPVVFIFIPLFKEWVILDSEVLVYCRVDRKLISFCISETHWKLDCQGLIFCAHWPRLTDTWHVLIVSLWDILSVCLRREEVNHLLNKVTQEEREN